MLKGQPHQHAAHPVKLTSGDASRDHFPAADEGSSGRMPGGDVSYDAHGGGRGEFGAQGAI
jgi:hypothetical protein